MIVLLQLRLSQRWIHRFAFKPLYLMTNGEICCRLAVGLSLMRIEFDSERNSSVWRLGRRSECPGPQMTSGLTGCRDSSQTLPTSWQVPEWPPSMTACTWAPVSAADVDLPPSPPNAATVSWTRCPGPAAIRQPQSDLATTRISLLMYPVSRDGSVTWPFWRHSDNEVSRSWPAVTTSESRRSVEESTLSHRNGTKIHSQNKTVENVENVCGDATIG